VVVFSLQYPTTDVVQVNWASSLPYSSACLIVRFVSRLGQRCFVKMRRISCFHGTIRVAFAFLILFELTAVELSVEWRCDTMSILPRILLLVTN